MGKDIVLKDKKGSWFNADYTGGDTNNTVSKRMIKLLNSERQDTYFIEDVTITKKDFGKYIVTGNAPLTRDDINNTIELTPLKVQRGHVVYEGEGANKKVITSVAHELRGEEKDEWNANHPGENYKNEVRMLGTLYDADTTFDMLKQLKDGKSNEFPLASYYFSGSAYTALFDLDEKHHNAIKDSEYSEYVQDASKAIKPLFRYKFESKQTESQSGMKYYIPEIKVGVNTAEEVNKLEPLFLKLKDSCLFDEDPHADIKKIESKEGEVVEEADIDDLPF